MNSNCNQGFQMGEVHGFNYENTFLGILKTLIFLEMNKELIDMQICYFLIELKSPLCSDIQLTFDVGYF